MGTVAVSWPVNSLERRFGRHSSNRTFIDSGATPSVSGEFQPLPGFLKKFHGLLAPYCREVFQKVVNRIASFQAVQKRPRRDSRACKHGHPAKDVWVTNNDAGNHEPNLFPALLSVNLSFPPHGRG